MRDVYHEELGGIIGDLVEMTRLSATAMSRATDALINADLDIAETVIAQDELIDKIQKGLESRAFDLLALQQPVATDLRIIFTSLRMSADLERMGDLAQHIAQVARMRYPDSAVPPEFRSTVLEMAQVAGRIVAKAGSVIAKRDVSTALALEQDDDEMDRLHRQMFTLLLDPTYRRGIETAIDLTLCGRYYERYCDHAVSIAKRVVYLVTGERAEDYTANEH